MAASLVSSDDFYLANFKVICWICNEFASPNFKGTLRHIAAVHSWDPDFFTLCQFYGCSRIKHGNILESADVISFTLLQSDINDDYSDNFVTGCKLNRIPQVHLELLVADVTVLIENKVSVTIKEFNHVQQNDDQLYGIIEDLKKNTLSLLKLCRHSSGLKEKESIVIARHKCSDDYNSDYCPTANLETHLFSLNDRAVQIFLYFQKLNICNLLGSRSKKHKLVPSTQLLAVANLQVILDHGINHLLNPVIEDIKVLETLVSVSIWFDGHEHIFKGTLVEVPGDNLASQYLKGYKVLNTAFRKCRHCLATAEDMALNENIMIVFYDHSSYL
uniref:Uncharacterized protein n=2 Tax=Amphimedon queenslandica TaxID=400682 RepID=A0A1X7V4Q6_AMPQE